MAGNCRRAFHPRYLLLVLLASYGIALQAEETTPLPQPLDLTYALSLAEDKQHPVLLEADALLGQADAEVLRAESDHAWRADLELKAAYLEPSVLATDQSQDEYIARLRLRKQLYDFGQSDLEMDSARGEYSAIKPYLQYQVERRRIDIAKRFAEVILADLKYAWDNEALAIAYIRMDNVREEHTLSRVSDVALLEAQTRYEEVRFERYSSENNQRITRALLAETMNRPGQLAADLKTPVLQYHQRDIPDYETLVDQALTNNAYLGLLEARLEAAGKRIQAARSRTRPTLDAEFAVSEYSRELSSNDDWRAQLNLTIPLLEPQGIQADIARERSSMLRQRASLLEERARIRQRVLELWKQVSLLKTRREQMQLMMEYRELSLDRNRALYEMEVETNLGDAQTAISEVRYKQASTDFELALAWMELDLLTRNKIDTGDIL